MKMRVMKYKSRFLNVEQNGSDLGCAVIEVNGIAPPHRRVQDAQVLVSEHDAPVVLLNIYVEVDADGFITKSCFKEILSNDDYVVVICGQHVHILDIANQSVESLYLNDYVGHIYAVPDYTEDTLSENFLVTTYRFVFLINVAQGILWKSEECGIDGVLIHGISDNIIFGAGDWDPPGGWEDFWLSLINGKPCNVAISD